MIDTKKFKVGDFVLIKGNAHGTVWETGIIEGFIPPENALIGHTTNRKSTWEQRLRGDFRQYQQGHPIDSLELL